MRPRREIADQKRSLFHHTILRLTSRPSKIALEGDLDLHSLRDAVLDAAASRRGKGFQLL